MLEITKINSTLQSLMYLTAAMLFWYEIDRSRGFSPYSYSKSIYSRYDHERCAGKYRNKPGNNPRKITVILRNPLPKHFVPQRLQSFHYRGKTLFELFFKVKKLRLRREWLPRRFRRLLLLGFTFNLLL